MGRFKTGLFTGMVGGLIMNIWTLFSYHILHFTDLRFLGGADILFFGRLPGSLQETIYSLLTQVLWGVLGIVFGYLMPIVPSRNYLPRGAFYGFITGSVVFAIPIAFGITNISSWTFKTMLSHLIGGTLWGIVLAQTLRWLNISPRVKS